MSATTGPQLAPPGAGLPTFELAIGRLLFAWRRRTGGRESFDRQFLQERRKIRDLLQGLEAQAAARRVLIPRLRGMEDSSRYWSVWMTLDHLRMVNGGITRTIGALTNGITPGGVASTAAVKPSAEVTGTVVAGYEKSCDDLLATVAAAKSLKTPLRHRHPWFGLLDATGWHALSANHMGIHRAQLERICAELRHKP